MSLEPVRCDVPLAGRTQVERECRLKVREDASALRQLIRRARRLWRPPIEREITGGASVACTRLPMIVSCDPRLSGCGRRGIVAVGVGDPIIKTQHPLSVVAVVDLHLPPAAVSPHLSRRRGCRRVIVAAGVSRRILSLEKPAVPVRALGRQHHLISRDAGLSRDRRCSVVVAAGVQGEADEKVDQPAGVLINLHHIDRACTAAASYSGGLALVGEEDAHALMVKVSIISRRRRLHPRYVCCCCRWGMEARKRAEGDGGGGIDPFL
ncbi:hypothetical protein Taro_045789 [Colocasia esculenta]|uniref:Uncharacterized protein n=1 Tax=Colocasia esculenta TaxID=4460 RepID=A0A843WXV2_COLES|nr:hypothetical protein [Colocasia esculenta]